MVESGICVFKRCLKLSHLPESSPFTITSFSRAVKLFAHLLNLRPIVLVAPSAAYQDELTAILPTALRGPSSAEWTGMGAGANYSGQAAIIAQQQSAFKKYWRFQYLQGIRKNHGLAEKGNFEVGAIVLVTNLSGNSGRSNPFPALGKI